ncbi:MAG: bifunctional [glutamate--ammonia ligase]-adenylyl-L-tyrosine phosphorylase/[glutamate--ammonia-ligase] adenylyltransferase [Burkholderiaceae bacterium]
MALHHAYEVAADHSGFARRSLARLDAAGLLMDPSRAITASHLKEHLAARWPEITEPSHDAAASLRQFRNSALLAIMARDLAGLSDLSENLSSISALAEQTIQLAYAVAAQGLAGRHGTPQDPHGQPVDLLIVGMGKLGGHELNASSDVDLIYLIPDDGQTTGVPLEDGTVGSQIDLSSFFGKVARRMSALLAEPTAEGFVFRVDLRLRPNGDAGPVICSLAMLEDYLIVQGREWERYAWIKARVVNQPVFQSPALFEASLEALESIRRPFVFRRYLDFNALAALRELHGQIREEAERRSQRREARLAGSHTPVDVKLGRGGIREIEFIAQLFQLIRGGREERLRDRSTRAVLATLREQGRLSDDEVRDLQEAYGFWRRLEHRLQYDEDAQTHVLGGSTSAYERAASAMGLANADALAEAIVIRQQRVSVLFDKLFRRDDTTQADPSEEPRPRPTDRESRMGRVKALIEQHANASQQPALVRQGLEALLDSLGRRASYLALFDEYPEAMARVARVVESSSWASDYLRRHPIVLDELLDSRTLMDPPDLSAFALDLERQMSEARLGDAPDVERQMDLLREAHHAQTFRLLVQDLEGLWTVERLSDQLSALADCLIRATLQAAWVATPKKHRDTPRFAVIAYGKLGGKELGYASDLDLIFVHDDPHELAQERYARLAQRMNVWLSTTTAAGSLFEIDLRLRPNGNAGLLVSDLPGFIRYQKEQAWVWEHQALTRVRFCAGDAEIGQAFESARIEILRMPRDQASLLEEILAMREKMHEGHPNPSGQFDLKHDTGGMVDIEFMVQALVLGHAHAHPSLTDNLGNIALLRRAADIGLISRPLAEATADAYRRFRQHQHRIRLSGAASARVEPDLLEPERAAVQALWAEVFSAAPEAIRPLAAIRQRTG